MKTRPTRDGLEHVPNTLRIVIILLFVACFVTGSLAQIQIPVQHSAGSSSGKLVQRTFGRKTVISPRALGKAWKGNSTFVNGQDLGVGAMQVSLVSDDELISKSNASFIIFLAHFTYLRLIVPNNPPVFDKAEANPLQVNGHSAWGQLYTLSTGKTKALDLITNSFCAAGGWLSNGTLLSIGGNVIDPANPVATNGNTALRFFTPCAPGGDCQVHEYPDIHLTSIRWYASTVRLPDGSIIIIGGTVQGGFNNAPDIDNPTIEFYPPKGDGKQIYFQFLHDWKTNQEYRLPDLPNGVMATYPASAASALLPLTIKNKYSAEILICGGSTQDLDNPNSLSVQAPTSTQCARIKIVGKESVGGWQLEQMPSARIMGDAILMPDGKVLIINGAHTGFCGYFNAVDQVGSSNAANPAFQPILYDPLAASGSRFSTNFPASQTERLYHSSATLVPDGSVFTAGSNPNANASPWSRHGRMALGQLGRVYNTEYLQPPYMSLPRPTFSGQPKKLLYKAQVTFSYTAPKGTKTIRAVINDIGYSTHGVHMNQRWLELKVLSAKDGKITLQGPPGPTYYPPGYGWLWILADDVPSKGKRVMVGKGKGQFF
ncbi:BQ2448_5642 [Microbotryum intermedium]|uniref:BQ2448_5642 protein n=1 Tax=Microbotryum intermedium TaxID=269621 RepID=A0A238F7C3_9BASI|nr:BQ2448_5642 [Microbotryum intermedium]